MKSGNQAATLKENAMNTDHTAAVYRLFERLHPGQPERTITTDDWTLHGSAAAKAVAAEADFVGCDPMDLVQLAQDMIAQDAAEYAAIPADEDAA